MHIVFHDRSPKQNGSINLEAHLETSPASSRVEETLGRLKSAGVLPILRAKNADVAIARGVELAQMGCRALEITLDSVRWG